jgi:hypothetical protein
MDETALFMDETAHFMDENVTFQSYGSKGHFMDETAILMEKKKYQPFVCVSAYDTRIVLFCIGYE